MPGQTARGRSAGGRKLVGKERMDVKDRINGHIRPAEAERRHSASSPRARTALSPGLGDPSLEIVADRLGGDAPK